MSLLDISAEVAREVVYGDGPDDIELIHDRIVDTRRWSIDHEVIVKHDGRFYRDTYSEGATEMQDESPWEYSEPNFREVFPVERTIIVYEDKADV